MDIYFVQWVIILYYLYVFSCSNCPGFGQWKPFRAGSCVLLSCPHLPLSTSLLFCLTNILDFSFDFLYTEACVLGVLIVLVL